MNKSWLSPVPATRVLRRTPLNQAGFLGAIAVQQVTHPSCQIGLRNRLLQEINTLIEPAVMDDGVA
jgi:hypothetical protein